MTVLAIDFGTSRIKAAYWDEAKGEAVVLPVGEGGRLYVPSLFYVNKAGNIRFGDDAQAMLYQDPHGVVENLKLKLGKPLQNLPNNRQAASSELIALLFRNTIQHSVREVKGFGGKPPEKIVLTYPALLDYSTIYKDALTAAGYNGETICICEPEAAGWAWVKEKSREQGEVLVVLDFGGGTVDWATLSVDEKRRPMMIADLPASGITAAGVDVDQGLFEEMMKHINKEQKSYAIANRARVIEQMRLLKESQNGRSLLSGKDCQMLEVQLGEDVYRFDRRVFDAVIKREALDQALISIEGYMKKVVKYQSEEGGHKQICCALVGGSRLLVGLEEQVKQRVKQTGKASGIEIKFAEIAPADFATVRGAVMREAPTRVKPRLYSRQVDIPENFVLIRGGEFTMGSPTYEPERQSNETQHQVRISDFYLCRYEVTQAEWESVIGTNPSYFKGANLPVEQVSWDDCQAFIETLNRKTGKKYRLPTEAEWEYACRAGASTPFNTGGNLTTEHANYNGDSPYNNNRKGKYRGVTVPVNSFEPNAWGLYGMHGNVWEWCSDWYDSGYYDVCKVYGVVDNPAGPETGSYRVIRGGCGGSNSGGCRSAYRFGFPPVNRNFSVGLRIVLAQ